MLLTYSWTSSAAAHCVDDDVALVCLVGGQSWSARASAIAWRELMTVSPHVAVAGTLLVPTVMQLVCRRRRGGVESSDEEAGGAEAEGDAADYACRWSAVERADRYRKRARDADGEVRQHLPRRRVEVLKCQAR